MKRKLVQAGGPPAVTSPAEVGQGFGLEKGMTGVLELEDGRTTKRFKTAAEALLDRRASLYRALAR